MGLKADNAQIGQNNTATNNFNLRAPLDGTLRVDRGNDGAVLSTPIKIESNNDITLLGNLLSGVLGAGQTWQNMLSSRALSTTYTNTTGKPICINVNASSTVNTYMIFTVSGVQSSVSGSQATVNNGMAGSIIIPIGATYSVALASGTPTLNTWTELR